MPANIPTPQTTLVVLLGASAWPHFPGFQSSEAFVNSAQGIKEYFLSPQGFSLPAENLLDLFDKDLSADDTDTAIEQFLRTRMAEMEAAGSHSRDILVYFTGHGGFVAGDYYLAIRRTRQTNPTISSIPITSLAKTIKECTRHLRRIVILDCCFSGASLPAFQAAGGLEEAVNVQTNRAFEEETGKAARRSNGFPGKGTALLCSSSRSQPSMIGERYTTFSGASLQVLRTGDKHSPKYLSLRTVGELVANILRETHTANAPRPEVHSPDQSEGDVAGEIPLFPNPFKEDAEVGRDVTDTAESASVFIGRQGEQGRFRDAVSNHIKHPKKHVFLISGPGGYGKSRLANRLCQIADAEFGIPSVMIDWDLCADAITSVINVMEVVADKVSLQFELIFDTFHDVLEVKNGLEAAVNALRDEFLTLQSQQGDTPSEFELYLAQHLSDTQKALLQNRTKTISQAFIQNVNAKLSTIGPVIVCFDTYERIDYRRHTGGAENFADLWVQRLIQDSPDNILFVISGRENHANIYTSRFGDTSIDSFSLEVFSRLDVSKYTRAHLGERMGVLTGQIFAFSHGIPLLVYLTIDIIKAYPHESYEDIFGTGQAISPKTGKGDEIRDEVLERAVPRILRYLQKELLLLTCFAAIVQLKSNDKLQRDLVSWTFERSYPHSSPISVVIDRAAQSFSSIFLQPATVLPELRPIIVEALLNGDINIRQADRDALLRQADAVLADRIASAEREVLPYDFPDDTRLIDYTMLIAQRINIYAWIDPKKCISLFIKECLVRSIHSFESLQGFIDLLAQAKLERVIPDVSREQYLHLLDDVSRPSFYKFLKSLPTRVLGDPQLHCLFEIVYLYLDVLMKSNAQGGIEALTRDGEVEKKMRSLVQRSLDFHETLEGYHICVGLVESHLEYAKTVAKYFPPSSTKGASGGKQGHSVPRPGAQVLDKRTLYQKEVEALQSTIPLLAELPSHYKSQRLNYVYLRLAKLAVLMSEFDSARTFADKAHQIAPDDKLTVEFLKKLPELIEAEAAMLLRQALYQVKDRAKVDAEAIEKFEKAAKLDPENTDVYRNLIRAYRRIREHAKALEASRKLLEINPSNVSGLVGRGEVLYELGYFAEAEYTFKRAMDLARQSGEDALNVYTNLGHCYVMLGTYDEALRYFDKRIEGGLRKVNHASSNPEQYKRLLGVQSNSLRHAFSRKAFVLLKLGRVEEAQQLFRSVLERDKNYHEAWMGRAIIERSNNRVELEQGIRACQRNIETNPSKISYYFHLAILYLLMNVFSEKECISYFRNALTETKDAYGFIYEAKFFMDLISERIDHALVPMQTVHEIASLLETYLQVKHAELPHPDNDRTASHLFMSYSNEDHGSFVKQLVTDLESKGYRIWVDNLDPRHHGLNRDQAWKQALANAINAATVIVLIITPDSMTSEWVRAEIHLAGGIRKPIIPIIARPTDPTLLQDFQISHDMTIADLHNIRDFASLGYETGFERLLSDLRMYGLHP